MAPSGPPASFPGPRAWHPAALFRLVPRRVSTVANARILGQEPAPEKAFARGGVPRVGASAPIAFLPAHARTGATEPRKDLPNRAVLGPRQAAFHKTFAAIEPRKPAVATFAPKYSTGGPWPPAAGGCCAAWGAALHPTFRHPGVRIALHHFPSIAGCVCLCFCSHLNAVPCCLCGLPRHPLEPIRVACLAAPGERQSRPFLIRAPLHPLLLAAVYRSLSRHEHTGP